MSTECDIIEDDHELSKIVNCYRCGNYELTLETLDVYNASILPTKALSLSYWIRNHQPAKGGVKINSDLMERLLVPFVSPKPKEQADNFILWVGSGIQRPNQATNCSATNLIPIIGAYDERGVQYIAEHLYKEGFIYQAELASENLVQCYKVQMRFKGWDRYYELQRSNKDSRLAFMAM